MDAPTNGRPVPGGLDCTRPTRDTLCIRLAGSWTIHQELPSTAQVQPHLDATQPVKRLVFDGRDVTEWDSGLLTFLRNLDQLCAQNHIEVDYAGLPPGVQRLLRLASAVPERQGARRQAVRESVLVRAGKKTLAMLEAARRRW